MFSNQALSTVTVNPVTDMQQDIETILSSMLKNTGLAYKKINAKTFVILPVKESLKSKGEIQSIGYTQMVPASVDETSRAHAFDDIITGKITDKNGNPVAGVTVSVKGKNRGTSTNANGLFSVEANKGEVLVFSSVGYEMQQVTVGNENNFSIQMIEKEGQLNEVVVTALGIQRKAKSLTYSTQKVSNSDLTSRSRSTTTRPSRAANARSRMPGCSPTCGASPARWWGRAWSRGTGS